MITERVQREVEGQVVSIPVRCGVLYQVLRWPILTWQCQTYSLSL